MYYVLLSFITKSVLTAAYLIFNLCYCYVHCSHRSYKYQHFICLCYIISCSVNSCSIWIGLNIPYNLLQYNIEQCFRSASPCVQPLSMPNASISWPWIFTFLFESCVIFIKFTNFFGIPNSSKISYKYVLFKDSLHRGLRSNMCYFSQAIKITLSQGVGETPHDLRPYRLLVSLLDKPDVGPVILDDILYEVFRWVALSWDWSFS
jgi:hypothetical protein